jgi:fructokinase
MPAPRFTVVGLGELLWDLLPTGKHLGGAPANFAYIASLLGDEGITASRVGADDLGGEALRRLRELGLPITFIQKDANHPTGTVKVEVDTAGQPCFQISEGAAWDFLEWTGQWQRLAAQADAVCFGSLAQRSELSRATICNFLQATRSDAVRIFDVNLRQKFFSAAILSDSMKLATIVKLNHEELPRIMQWLGLEHQDEESSARRLLALNESAPNRASVRHASARQPSLHQASLHKVQMVCVTRGNGGSLLVTVDGCNAHPGFRVKVVDTVGAGDAFTAALVHEYLRGAPLERMNEMANRVGAWVASEAGAMPTLKPGGLKETLEAI